jgi:hypothetical protein
MEALTILEHAKWLKETQLKDSIKSMILLIIVVGFGMQGQGQIIKGFCTPGIGRMSKNQ